MAEGDGDNLSNRMRCHYEVLSVPRDCTEADLKKSYRKLALKYHPDKNPDSVAECTRQFREVQQAYDVLTDPQERAWYDKHREAILRGVGSGYKDDSIDLMPFFSASCYNGFTDDPKGFYGIYNMVFERIKKEDDQFRSENDKEDIPQFGDSQTDYEEVCHFYGYWQSYYTSKTYEWEDKFDLRDAPNRRVQRAMEKENKKAREAVKREKNETIRQLVSFVRKRDKRMEAYKEQLKQKEADRQKKVAEKRTTELKKKQQRQAQYEEQEWQSMASLENEMREMEARLDGEFGKESDIEDDSTDENEPNPDLFCVVCNKLFRTPKALANHEKSKKHKENLAALKQVLQEEEENIPQPLSDGSDSELDLIIDNNGRRNDTIGDSVSDACSDKDGDTHSDKGSDTHGDIDGHSDQRNEEESRQDVNVAEQFSSVVENDGVHNRNEESKSCNKDVDNDEDLLFLTQNKKRQKESQPLDDLDDQFGLISVTTAEKSEEHLSPHQRESEESKKTKGKKKGKPSSAKQPVAAAASGDSNLLCHKCNKNFPSRNKLFQHIKETGHALRVSNDTLSFTLTDAANVSKKNKKKRSSRT